MNCTCYSLRIGGIVDCEVAEWHISDGNVHQIIAYPCFFKTLHAHVCIRIQLLCNPAGHAVQLHQRPSPHLLLHVRRHGADKVTDAAAWFQHASAVKAQVVQAVVHGANHVQAGVVCVQRAGAGCRVFVRRQCAQKLLVFALPVLVVFIKCLAQSAPAHIPGQNRALFRRGKAAFGFQALHQADCVQIRLETCFFAPGQIQRFTDHMVGAARRVRSLALFLSVHFIVQLLLGCAFLFLGLSFAHYFSGGRSYMISFTNSLASFSYRPSAIRSTIICSIRSPRSFSVGNSVPFSAICRYIFGRYFRQYSSCSSAVPGRLFICSFVSSVFIPFRPLSGGTFFCSFSGAFAFIVESILQERRIFGVLAIHKGYIYRADSFFACIVPFQGKFRKPSTIQAAVLGVHVHVLIGSPLHYQVAGALGYALQDVRHAFNGLGVVFCGLGHFQRGFFLGFGFCCCVVSLRSCVIDFPGCIISFLGYVISFRDFVFFLCSLMDCFGLACHFFQCNSRRAIFLNFVFGGQRFFGLYFRFRACRFRYFLRLCVDFCAFFLGYFHFGGSRNFFQDGIRRFLCCRIRLFFSYGFQDALLSGLLSVFVQSPAEVLAKGCISFFFDSVRIKGYACLALVKVM